VLALTQIAVHARRGRPPWPAGLPRWQRRTAAATHALLFCLLLAIPLVGYLVAATAPARVPTLFLGVIPVPHVIGTSAPRFAVLRRVHLALAVSILLLACLHALAAVHHQRAGRAVLLRMWSGRA